MTAIIRHLLDFGRRGGSSRISVDLNDVASHAVDLLLPMAKKQGCGLVLESAERPFRRWPIWLRLSRSSRTGSSTPCKRCRLEAQREFTSR